MQLMFLMLLVDLLRRMPRLSPVLGQRPETASNSAVQAFALDSLRVRIVLTTTHRKRRKGRPFALGLPLAIEADRKVKARARTVGRDLPARTETPFQARTQEEFPLPAKEIVRLVGDF